MLLKGKILPILSCFLFLFDESMIEYWYPRKTMQGQKSIKLADIASLNICVLLYGIGFVFERWILFKI